MSEPSRGDVHSASFNVDGSVEIEAYDGLGKKLIPTRVVVNGVDYIPSLATRTPLS